MCLPGIMDTSPFSPLDTYCCKLYYVHAPIVFFFGIPLLILNGFVHVSRDGQEWRQVRGPGRPPVSTYYVAPPKIEIRPYLRRNFLGFQGIISANAERCHMARKCL